MSHIHTTCPYCGVGCGIIASNDDQGALSLRGDPAHPANFGRLCSKGAALGETLGVEGRLLHPEVDGERVDWSSALDAVANGFRRTIDAHGPDAVAFYLSGQLLTEDYYVANKLMKGFIGSANIDTNSRLCMASAVAGYKRAFGADAVPCSYDDLERAKLIILVGSNAAWCHPVLFQRIARAREENPDLQVVVIDPRHTPTCEIADLHMQIRPGSDLALFNGLLAFLSESGELNESYIAAHTEGFDAALAAAQAMAPEIDSVAAQCDLAAATVQRFFRLFARTERVVTLYSQGVNQWSHGSDNNNAIINCHLATGRLARPGMGPFSLTGQPNAMGGREVGGLANQLAAHMEFSDGDCDCVQRFWNAPAIARKPGLKAVELFHAMETGKIKAVWIMGTNPAVSLPHSASVRRALEKCELVVVSDVTGETDTLRHAHIKLPALAWGEKEGSVTNSERRISRQRAFLPVPGEARADWWILAEVGKRLGHTQAFSYGCPAEIFGEHAALSAFENDHTRAFTIGALANLEKHQYDSLAPVQWPITEDRPQDTTRLFNDGKFFTPTGKAQFVAISSAGKKKEDTPDFPLLINTGRIRDQWHTMTRTGLSSRLAKHTPEPSITLHPYDAENLRVKEGGLALISTPQGNLITRVRVDGGQRPGEAFLPMHWNGCFASRAGANTLIAAHSDPISGQPEFKRTAGVIAPFHPKWSGVLLSRASVPSPAVAYWARYRGAEVWSYQLADEEPLSLDALRALLPLGSETDLSEYVDENGSRYRAALWSKGRLVSYLWAASDGIPPVTHWIEEIFHRHEVATEERMALLAGRPLTDSAPAGRAVCACHGVDENAVCAAIAKGCDSIASIGEKTKAGTGCGACMPELSRLLSQAATAKRR